MYVVFVIVAWVVRYNLMVVIQSSDIVCGALTIDKHVMCTESA